MDKKLAIFDFDGTISTKDSTKEFLKYNYGIIKFLYGYYFIFSINLVLCLIGIGSFAKLKKKRIKFFFQKKDSNLLIKKSNSFYKSSFQNFLKKDALKRLKWHSKNKHKIVILSASLDIILNQWCKDNKYLLITNKLQIKNNKFTGCFNEDDCSGNQKVNMLLNHLNIDDYVLTYGYGDTKADIPFLNIVDKKYYKYFKK